MSNWGVLFAVGPGELEVERLADTVESLHAYEPSVDLVVLVDDEPEADRDLRAASGFLSDRTVVRINPRSRDLDGWSDGLAVGLATGFKHFNAESEVEWVLKMDTDALVIGPFAKAISERFSTDPTIGMVGTHDRRRDGTPRTCLPCANHMRKLVAPISIWRPPHGPIRSSLVGRGRQRRVVVEAALTNGYKFGEHCQGGAYAVASRALRAIENHGWFDTDMWFGTRTAEDMVLSTEVLACGYGLAGMVGPGEPFAISHVGLDGEPQTLHDEGCGLIHSVKTHGEWTERQLRELFRGYRAEHAESDET